MKRLLRVCAIVLASGAFTSLAQSPPDLLIDLTTDSRVRLSWPDTPGNIILEETDTLTLWQPFPQIPTLLNGQLSVTADITGGARFFRLHETGGLPPDPASIAPPVPQGVATLLAEATEFLYTGTNRIQTGVAPGTIDARRAAVVRGKVKKRDDTPLSGVTISILNHPELGQTLSRADGRFDLAVNGGGLLIVKYEKTDFCPVQRQINVPWQDYVTVADVVMIQMDPLVTPIALGLNSPMQVHQGSMQTDADGARKATLLFTPGTCGSLVLPDGTTQECSSISVRATEFTVGPNGPAAMPANLPPTSAYTYCVEFSADEAISTGAMTVAFTQPVINYVENFLKFPVGIAVPTGFYDRQKGAWVPSRNGRVIKILNITGGLAEVDTDGDTVADLGLGISSEERQNLATLYAAGQTLWRVPIPHFSVCDENYSFLTEDATTPGQSGARADPDYEPQQCDTVVSGSIIECENQVLGDSGLIVGTPYSLNYRSDRVPGRSTALNLTLSGPSVPASLKRIELHITVGGRTFDQTFPPNPNQQFTFVWDRQDAYGRTLQGGQPLTGSIDYIYPVNYAGSNTDPAFSVPGGFTLLENPARQEFIISEPFKTVIGEGLTDARVVGLGGWTLNVNHFFDPVARVMHTGDGGRRRADSVSRIISSLLGPSSVSRALAVGPDGSVYFSRQGDRIQRLALDGTETIVAGNGTIGDPSGDGGPAIQATIFLEEIAVGPDGSLYFTQAGAVRRVDPDGIISRVAGKYCTGGGGCPDPGPDGGLATETDMQFPGGVAQTVAVGVDGSLYLVNVFPGTPFQINRIRRVGPDGIITTVAGTTESCFFGDGICGDGGPATQAQLSQVSAVALAPDGSLYIADANSIRRVRTDGIIERVAGSILNNGFSGDGGPAINAALCGPFGLAFGSDGSLYFADNRNNRIRVIDAKGIINTFAGSGPTSCGSPGTVGLRGDGGPALAAILGSPYNVALDPDGVLYVTAGDQGPLQIKRIGSALPGISEAESLIASQDGSELYVFNGSGRHLRTVHALTGAALLEFGYDAGGRLTQVTEKTGGTDNITTILHDGVGNPTAIVGPFGQQTTLAVDANGFLESIINPANEEMQFTSTADGLLTSYTDPRGKTSVYLYGGDGRLIQDADPAGGTQTLARVAGTDTFTVSRTTALNRVTTYQTAKLPSNIERRTTTAPDGTQSQSTENIDAATTHITSSDGSISDITLSADPRFGIQSPVTASFSLQFPSSLKFTAVGTRSAVLTNSANPLSLVSLTDTATLDGHTITRTYNASSRTMVDTSPTRRTRTRTFDALGRLTQDQVAGLLSSSVAYENRGRLESLSVGSGANSRSVSLAYNAQGFLDTVTDSIGRSAHYLHDATGRVTSKTLPDGRIVRFDYDDAGNLTSITPPDRPAHTFGYSDRDELTLISPPSLPGTGNTTFAYDADGALTTINRAGVQTIAMSYDAAGRPATRTLTSGGGLPAIDTFGYDAAGRLTTIAGANGVNIGHTFDGPLPTGETWTGPVAGTVTRTYNTALRLANQSVNGTNTIAFTYDDDDLLTGAGSLAIARDSENGLPTGTTLGLVTSSLTYNGSGEVTNYTASASGTVVYSNVFSLDGLGRIGQNVETVEGITDTFSYTYNLAGQLTAVTRNGLTIESYAYDANGNRTNTTVGGVTVNATYDAQDRLTQYGSATFTYNAAGDLVSKSNGGQTTTYEYDALGNLLGVTLPNATAISYLIDGRNRRVGKKVNGTPVKGFLYGDALRPVAELDAAGTLISRFVYAGRTVPAYMIKEGVAHRIITDHLGSVRLVVNSATGGIVQRMDYDSFGNVTLDTNSGFQPFGFAGGIYDSDTGLVRFGARDYDSSIGRWTAKDPIDFGGGDSNLYRYVRNNPVNLVDHLGQGPDDWDDWLDEVTDVEKTLEELKNKDPFERKFTEVIDPKKAEERRIRQLLGKVDDLAKFAKKIPGPVKAGCILAGFLTLAEDAKANEQSLVEQAAENALPVEAKTIRETLEGFAGGVYETIAAQFADLVPAR